jgi:hypothetical protein
MPEILVPKILNFVTSSLVGPSQLILCGFVIITCEHGGEIALDVVKFRVVQFAKAWMQHTANQYRFRGKLLTMTRKTKPLHIISSIRMMTILKIAQHFINALLM